MIEHDLCKSDLTIISGGQLGADRAGLQAAKDAGVNTGGWAPHGWKTLLGSERELLESFGLKEHPVSGYPARTEQNVKESECTLIVSQSFSSAGTALTIKLCQLHHRPYFLVHTKSVNRHMMPAIQAIRDGGFKVINIAGNGEHTPNGPVFKVAYHVVSTLLATFD